MEGHPLNKRVNRTLLALISNVQGLEKVSQLRPISLCTTVYKIITFYRLRLLMTKLMRQNQASFVMGNN